MKIAVVTDDGSTLARHFGRARYYQVYTVTDGAVEQEELRDRAGTLHHGHHHGHDDHHHHHGHSDHSHAGMVEQIEDVDVLIVGGMGSGARQAMDAAGIHVVATSLNQTRPAVEALLSGTLSHEDSLFH